MVALPFSGQRQRRELQGLVNDATRAFAASTQHLVAAARALQAAATKELSELNASPVKRTKPGAAHETPEDEVVVQDIIANRIAAIPVATIERWLQRVPLHMDFRLMRFLWPAEKKVAWLNAAQAAQNTAQQVDVQATQEDTLVSALTESFAALPKFGRSSAKEAQVRENLAKLTAVTAQNEATANAFTAQAQSLPADRLATEKQRAAEITGYLAAAIVSAGVANGRKVAAHTIMLIVHAFTVGQFAANHQHGVIIIEHIIKGYNVLVHRIPLLSNLHDRAMEQAFQRMDHMFGGLLTQIVNVPNFAVSELQPLLENLFTKEWVTG